MEVTNLIPVIRSDGHVVGPPDLSVHGPRWRAAFRATIHPTGTPANRRAVVGAVTGG